ncbi:DUF2087 domain-containing protein [Pseudooceanicola sp. MF1-13]|uniref:DUF2087 domain-containing protein n=1 Tax=Pseudooceanicola sp. MF1-13 TaxID=3379095 RepID=UPI003891E7A5
MTRTPLPLATDDLSTFARHLSRQLGDSAPSHLSLMNMLARAAGYQNVQHLRATQAAANRLPAEAPPQQIDHRPIERTLHQFDGQGRLKQWPSRRAVQTLALYALWAVVPSQTPLTEKQVNAALNAEHLFTDAATLRRTMIANRLLIRTTDGSEYRRVEHEPPAEARDLIARLKSRRAARVAMA